MRTIDLPYPGLSDRVIAGRSRSKPMNEPGDCLQNQSLRAKIGFVLQDFLGCVAAPPNALLVRSANCSTNRYDRLRALAPETPYYQQPAFPGNIYLTPLSVIVHDLVNAVNQKDSGKRNGRR
ncbi:MAG: hypothetical protein ACKV22_13250 [Bryobacteraceae bacterium]